MAQSMIKAKGFQHFSFAMELDKNFDLPLSQDEFFNLVEALQAIGNEDKQQKAVDFFKTLSKEELNKRTYAITKLSNALKSIQSNRI